MPASEDRLDELLSKPLDDALPQRLVRLVGVGEVRELAQLTTEALHGSQGATRRYVASYRQVTRRLLELAAETHPELVRIVDDEVQVGDPATSIGGFIAAALEQTAGEAPFSRWAAVRGIEEGVPLHALASLRALLPDTRPLDPPVSPRVLAISERDSRRFLAAVRRSLNADQPPLERIRGIFGLTNTELGRLFGITRQGAKDWLDRGVPVDRQDKLATVAAVADLLERKLKADRIPGIARRPAAAYDQQSMLDLIAADRHQELLDITRRSFDWATAV